MILSLLYLIFTAPYPPAGIREESDRGLGNALVQAGKDDVLDLPAKKPIATPKDLRGFPGNKERDFTPPTDRLGDRINAQLKAELENKNVKPIIAVRNQDEVWRAAKASGRNVMWWTFWPDVYTATAEYFEELSEVQHILIENPWGDAGEYIIADWTKDGAVTIRAESILGKGCAAKVRKYWDAKRGKVGGDTQWMQGGDPARLTTAERDAVQATMIRANENGKVTAMSVREAVAKGGKITADVCKAAGFSQDEAAYAVGLTLPSAFGRYDGLGGRQEAPVYSGGGTASYARGSYSGGASRSAAPAYYQQSYQQPQGYAQAPRQMMPMRSPPPAQAPRMQFANAPLRGG